MTAISVVTATFRPGAFLLEQAKGLMRQTFTDFEWIIVDDLHAERAEDFANLIAASTFPVRHIPPRVLKQEFAAASAWNSAFPYCRGELCYFMNDYVGLAPDVLARHWALYQQYGPDVIISGPLTAMAGATQAEGRPADVMLTDKVGEITTVEKIRRYYWAGRNDSAPLARILEANGFDERCDGAHGGQDVELAMRLVNLGCRYLVDHEAMAFEYPHQKGKIEPGHAVDWKELFASAQGGRTWAPNAWIIKDAREAVLGSAR